MYMNAHSFPIILFLLTVKCISYSRWTWLFKFDNLHRCGEVVCARTPFFFIRFVWSRVFIINVTPGIYSKTHGRINPIPWIHCHPKYCFYLFWIYKEIRFGYDYVTIKVKRYKSLEWIADREDVTYLSFPWKALRCVAILLWRHDDNC